MTSTNDGKDVKSIQTSGQKGKTYYIELYKSLDTRLSGECSGEDRTRLVCEAWRLVHSLCQHSTPSTQTHLLLWLQQHTSHTILQTEWQAPTSKEQHTWLKNAINVFISECREAASKKDGVNLPWEAQFLNRARWFLNVLPNPWGHHVLKALLDSEGKQPSDKEVLEWLKEERGLMFATRLRQLAASKRCVDLALLLATAIMNRVRFTTKIVADAVQAQEPKDKPEVLTNEPTFYNILRKEAGFTQDVWDLITDIEFVLHYKGESRARCIELAKQTPLRNAYQLVGRLHNRLENSPLDKKLWKNAKDVATLIAQVVVARCMVVPVCAGAAHDALYRCVYSLAQLLPADKLPAAAAALAAPAATSRHLHTLAAAVHAQCKDERKPFVCSLYVRAITAGMNELEKLKLETEKQSEARAIEQILASWFIQLGTLLSASSRLSYECILTAFSVHPSPTMYAMVKRSPLLAPLIMLDVQEQGADTNSEYGSWATDSRTQTNLVKTSETLKLKQTQKQANVLSTAIFAEGEGLGLEADLCQDLAVLLSGPRVKTLYWDLDREVLLENCRTYMERTHDGTRALTTELKYLNLDPNSFQHLPEEEDEDESNIYYGIEKGYEHLVEFEEPEPEDILCDHILTDYSYTSDSASSIIELPMVIPKQKKKKNKDLQLSTQEEVDPLSLVTDTLSDNKEIPHSIESSKHKSKERSKSKIRIERTKEHDGNNGITGQITKEIHKKSKKKERKERKKMEKQSVCDIKVKEQNFQSSTNLSRLVGMKIARPNLNEQERRHINSNVNNTVSITDSDYDSQGKSSINSEYNDNNLTDGLYSIDEVNSSIKRLTDYKHRTNFPPFSYSPHTVTSVKEEVKKGIQKLIEYRRKKVFNENSASWDSPENRRPDCNVDHDLLVSKNLPSNIFPVISSKCVNEANLICETSNNERNYTSEKETLDISHLKIKDKQELSAKERSVKKSQPKIFKPKHSSTFMKHAENNLPETPSQKQYQQFLLQRKWDSIQSQHSPSQSQHSPSQSQSQFQKFLKKQYIQELELPGHLVEDLPKQQTSQQMNTNVSPSQKQYHNFLKELQETINAGTNNDMQDSKYSTTKTTQTVTKKFIQPKKVDNAANTYSRLSYMHKNKQCDIKLKSANNQIIHKTSLVNITTQEMQNIKDIDLEKVSNLQLTGQIVIAKIDKSKNKCSDENDKVLVENVENLSGCASSAHSPLNNPMLSNKLSSDKVKTECTVQQNDIKVIKDKPSQRTTSFLSEKDQLDLLLLLRQQNKMDPPKMPVKTEILNNSSGILLNNCAADFADSKKQSLDTQSQIPVLIEGLKSKSCPTSVIKTTNKKSLNNGSEPKKNRVKGSKQKVKTQIESDWKSVMDDLLAHKTPSRGPNALDIVLNKDSFEKRFSDSLNNSNNRTVITSCINLNKSVNNDNIGKQNTFVNASTSRENVMNLKSTLKSSEDLKYKQDMVQVINKINSVEIKKGPVPIQGKNFPSVIQNSNDPFISGIPNSDYDLLEELMDDDLRQEIGELSSDEETYRTPNLSTSKTKNNLHTKELNVQINKTNSLAAGNPLNFSSIFSSDSVKNSYNTNYSILHEELPSKNNSLPKGITPKKPAFATDADFKIICNEIITNSKSVKKTPLSGKGVINVSGMTPGACHGKKKKPVTITSKIKIQNANKTCNEIFSNPKLSKTVDNTKVHTSKVNKASKSRTILDPAQVILTVPKGNNAQNVMLVGTDLIYDRFSTMHLNQATKSENLSDLNSNTYVAGNQKPVNVALLHSAPFIGPVLGPVIIESSVALPVVQKVSPNIAMNVTSFNSEKPEISTICKENQHTNKIKTESIKPKALTEKTCHKDEFKASKSKATGRRSTEVDFEILTTTPTALNNDVASDSAQSNLVNSKKHDILKVSDSYKMANINEYNYQTVEATNLDTRFDGKDQEDKRCPINEEIDVNTLADKTLSLNTKTDVSIDQERINKKRLFMLNRLDNFQNRSHEIPIALPYASITSSRDDIEEKESYVKVTHDAKNIRNTRSRHISNKKDLCQKESFGLAIVKYSYEIPSAVTDLAVTAQEAKKASKEKETTLHNSVKKKFLSKDNNVVMKLRSFISANFSENHSTSMNKSEPKNQTNNMDHGPAVELVSKENTDEENLNAKLINEGNVNIKGDETDQHLKSVETQTDVIEKTCKKKENISFNKSALSSCQSLPCENAEKEPIDVFCDCTENVKCTSKQLLEHQSVDSTSEIPQQKQLYTSDESLKKANESKAKSHTEKNTDNNVEMKLVGTKEQIKADMIQSIIKETDELCKDNITLIGNKTLTPQTIQNTAKISDKIDKLRLCTDKIPLVTNNNTPHEQEVSSLISQGINSSTKESDQLCKDRLLYEKNVPCSISQSVKDLNKNLSAQQQPNVTSNVTKIVQDILGIKNPEINTGKSRQQQTTKRKQAFPSRSTMKNVHRTNLETLGQEKGRNDDCNKKDSLILDNEKSILNNSNLLDAKITFDELPSECNGPLKRCVRIKLPNGNTFKATISGKLNVKIDSLFDDPTVKSLLWKNINNNTKCTLNIKQVSIQNKKEEILKTEVKNISYPKPVIMTTDTINLISDDEEEIIPQRFKTEFGYFNIASMDPRIQIKHQGKLSQKSVVVLKRCSVLQEYAPKDLANIRSSVPDIDGIPIENPLSIPQEIVTDYIEIDDSSNDSISVVSPVTDTNENTKTTLSSKKVDELKNLLLKELGVDVNNSDVQSENLDVTNEVITNIEEVNNRNDIQTELQKSTNDIDQKIKEVTLSVQHTESKSRHCLLKLTKCDDLVEQLRIKNRKCFVNLVRCDDALQGFENKVDNKVIEESLDEILCLEDGITETTLKRSDSFSILNELDNSSIDLSIFHEGTIEPISTSLIDSKIPVNQTENLLSNINILLKLTHKKCEADWFITKSFLNKYKNIVSHLPRVSLNNFKECESDEESLTDCDSDLDASLLTDESFQVPRLVTLIVNFLVNNSDVINRLTKTDLTLKNVTNSSTLTYCDSRFDASFSTDQNFQVPRLATLIVNFLANDSDVMVRLTNTELTSKNVTNSSPLKRKSTEIGEIELQNKISKMENKLSLEQQCHTQKNTTYNTGIYDTIVHKSETIVSHCSLKHEKSNLLVFDNEMNESNLKEASQNVPMHERTQRQEVVSLFQTATKNLEIVKENMYFKKFPTTSQPLKLTSLDNVNAEPLKLTSLDNVNADSHFENTSGTNSTIPMEIEVNNISDRNNLKTNKDLSEGVQSIERATCNIKISEKAEYSEINENTSRKESYKKNNDTCTTYIPLRAIVDNNVMQASTTCNIKTCSAIIESDSRSQSKIESNTDIRIIKMSPNDVICVTKIKENANCAIKYSENSTQSNEREHDYLLTDNNTSDSETFQIKTNLKMNHIIISNANEYDKNNACTEYEIAKPCALSTLTNHFHLNSPNLSEVTPDFKINNAIDSKTNEYVAQVYNFEDKDSSEVLLNEVTQIVIDSNDHENGRLNLIGKNDSKASTKALTLNQAVSSNSNLSFQTDVRIDFKVKESKLNGTHDLHIRLESGTNLTKDTKIPESESELHITTQLKNVSNSHEDGINGALDHFKRCTQAPVRAVLTKQLGIEKNIFSCSLKKSKEILGNSTQNTSYIDDALKLPENNIFIDAEIKNTKTCIKNEIDSMNENGHLTNSEYIYDSDLEMEKGKYTCDENKLNEHTKLLENKVLPEIYDEIVKRDSVVVMDTEINDIHSEASPKNSVVLNAITKEETVNYLSDKCNSKTEVTLTKPLRLFQQKLNYEESLQINDKSTLYRGVVCSLEETKDRILDVTKHTNNLDNEDGRNSMKVHIENTPTSCGLNLPTKVGEAIINSPTNQNLKIDHTDDVTPLEYLKEEIVRNEVCGELGARCSEKKECVNSKKETSGLSELDFSFESKYYTTPETTNVDKKYQNNETENARAQNDNLISVKEKKMNYVLGSIDRIFQTNQGINDNSEWYSVNHKTSPLKNVIDEFGYDETDEKAETGTPNDDTKLQKNVTLVYKGDSNVILKGSLYEDSVVGTCYVFPVINRKLLNHELNCSNICNDKTINVKEETIKCKVYEDCNKLNVLEDVQTVENFSVVLPKLTYSRQILKNNDNISDHIGDKRNRKNLKRKLSCHDSKLYAKRYRNGKNIDYPKFSVATMLESAYSKEYKRLMDYCASIKFSYSRPFHKEYINVPDILKCWPIKELDAPELDDNTDFENTLFSEDQFINYAPFDPLQYTLAEEIYQCNEHQYVSYDINETNFNMGFGEESDRVIQILEDGNNISNVSAATLSDVKQTQPFLTSEDYVDDKKQKLYMSHKHQIEILKRSISYIKLRDKVRSYFKKTTEELNYNWLVDNIKSKNEHSYNNCTYLKSGFPYDLMDSNFIEPAPVEPIVNIVQVGQLSVSAAAQNPMTCDPRVTQVTNASPQCSIENSPHDDSHPPIKTEYTELTTADLSMPIEHEYDRHNMESQETSKMPNSHNEDIPVETELTSVIKTEITVELSPLKEEPIDYNDSDDLQSLVNKHINNVDYSFDSNDNSIQEPQLNRDISYDESLENHDADFSPQERQQNGSSEKTDQIAYAMNAAGITTTPETMVNTEAHALVNMFSQTNCQVVPAVSTASSANNYSKTPMNTMTLQQALAQILPPPLKQTNVHENNQTNMNSSITSQVLHIVQGKNTNGNQLTLVDNTQNSVINNSNTPVLHIVQNKGAITNSTPNANSGQHANSYGGLSLVDGGQGSNQLLHIVNTGNPKNNTTGQLIKRVNLLTNLQGSNEQKMVQFVCKSADGKSIHLNAPHQRSMVLRLQPIESPNIQPNSKATESQDNTSTSTTSNTKNATSNKELTNAQNEIKSRSVYEENYAKFIQNSSNKPVEKCTSLPKFGQAFGKQVFQEDNPKKNDINDNNSNMRSINSSSENSECQPNDNSVNLDHIGQINSPPLLLRKSPTQSAQTQPSQANLVQQIKQTIGPMNIQTMHGGVIYTRQIPVNIGGGQTINLITVPSTELTDDTNQKQKSDVKFVNQNDLDSPIIKIVPQNQSTPNAEGTQDDTNKHTGLPNENAQNTSTQNQPVLTQMRIKLPMLSKAPQMVSGARVVRPSFFQIQRNVIGGANQHVYQQLVLTAAPPLGQHTIRLPQAQANRTKTTTDGQSTSEPQMSSSTLEQLREFDMVLEQVKERSTVQPNLNSNGTFTKMQTPTTDTSGDGTSVTSTVTESKQQVLYSIGSNQSLNVAYINRKTVATTPTTSTFVRSPDSSGIIDSPSSSHAQIPHTVTSESTLSEASAQPNQAKPVKNGSKAKSKSKSSNPPHAMKIGIPPKPSLKPQEDEQTLQRILYILAEYKEQVENCPEQNKPAPRRRLNPPTNPGSSKRKKSSSSSRRSGARDMSPVNGDDTCRTMGSEDSSCGTSQGDCNESCRDSRSPQEDIPRKVVRKLTFENETAPATQTKPQPQRNVIVADGQTITVARGTAGKPTTAVLMPANYILPVSMVKGGKQIAIVTNRGPKLLTVAGGEGATNALLLQRLIGPAGLKPVLTRPGVRQFRLPTAALQNLQAFNLTTATTVQPPDSTAPPAAASAPPGLVETKARSSSCTDRDSVVKPKRDSSSEGSEPWNLHSSADSHDYAYEERVRTDNINRTVLEAIPGRYSPDMEAQRIFDKMFDVDSKKSYIDSHDDSSRCAYDIDASDCDDKVYHQVVHRKDGSTQRHHRRTHVTAAALRHKYAILEHEIRLQKSLSEECEDLGVDSPSAAELFPEAELLFAASPAHEATQHPHTRKISLHTQPTILSQGGIPQPDIDDQIATDEILQRDVQDDQQDELDVSSLGLDEGIVTVNENGQATITLDQEEFARSHPNTTFHREPTDEGEVQPFTIIGPKGRHITTTIFHAGRAPATVLVTAPQTTVISQANPDHAMQNQAKYVNQMINHQSSAVAHGNLNLSTVLVKDNRLTKFDSILTDSRELHLSNTASAIIHSTGNATQVIRRVCYEDDKRDTRFLMDEPDAIIAGDDAKMIAEDSSRDATLESIAGDDENSLPERQTELFWESNSASERSESRRPIDFSSDSEKCCKSPSFDETNSTDSSGVGTHMRLDSVIKNARGMERSCSADGSSADDTHPPLRTYPAKRMYHVLDGDVERSVSGKTRAGERSPYSLEVRRRASGRGVVKRGCHCCTGSPAPPRPKKSRQRKPTIDFTN